MDKKGALNLYLGLRFFSALFFGTIVTVNLVYQAVVVGLNPLQLVLVGTLLESVCFFFEVPTGIVADLYSRKISVVIGLFLTGIGFVFEGTFPTFEGVLIAQVIWGIGATFVSGAREAWIADEVGDAAAGKAFMRGQKFNQVGMFLGIILGMLLANIDIRLPIILGGILYALQSIYLLIFMPEDNFKPVPPKKRETFAAMKRTFLNGFYNVKKDKKLLSIVTIVMIFGMFSEGLDRLWTPFLISDFSFPEIGGLQPVVWFGIISLIATLMAAFMIEIIGRRIDTNNQDSITRTLYLVNLSLALMVFIFCISAGFISAAAAYCFVFMLKESFGPLTEILINKGVKKDVRATIFSFSSQVNSLGQVTFGPILGLIASLISIKVGIIAAGAILLLSLPLYNYLFKAYRLKRINI